MVFCMHGYCNMQTKLSSINKLITGSITSVSLPRTLNVAFAWHINLYTDTVVATIDPMKNGVESSYLMKDGGRT